LQSLCGPKQLGFKVSYWAANLAQYTDKSSHQKSSRHTLSTPTLQAAVAGGAGSPSLPPPAPNPFLRPLPVPFPPLMTAFYMYCSLVAP